MITTWTRRLAASLLLFCLGLTVPAVGGPMHLCISGLLAPQTMQDGCCSVSQSCCDQTNSCCDTENPFDLPCCVELDDLPDAETPPSPQTTPSTPVTDLGWSSTLPSLGTQIGADASSKRPERIRGPYTASHHRALLEIWRL